MQPKPLDSIKAPDRANLCNGEGYISPTETYALNNVFREAYRAPAPATPKTLVYHETRKQPSPRVSQATTVQLEQELARRKAEERKQKEAAGEIDYKEWKKKTLQMNVVVTTLCKMVGLEFDGVMQFKVRATGDVFGAETFNTASRKERRYINEKI